MATANGAKVADTDAFANEGIKITIDVNSMDANPANNHLYNVIQYMQNDVGIEYGLKDGPGDALYLYYWVFAPNGAIIATNDNHLKKVTDWDAPHTLEISYTGIGTKWSLYFDEKKIATFSTGSVTSGDDVPGEQSAILALVELGDTAPTDAVVFSGFQYNQDGVWHDVAAATAYNTGDDWAIVGNLQDPAVPVGTFEVGGVSLLGATPPEYLWGGP